MVKKMNLNPANVNEEAERLFIQLSIAGSDSSARDVAFFFRRVMENPALKRGFLEAKRLGLFD